MNSKDSSKSSNKKKPPKIVDISKLKINFSADMILVFLFYSKNMYTKYLTIGEKISNSKIFPVSQNHQWAKCI